ncbi:MAG: pantoate--beta-alanine ligase [Breznakibacter sp.]
MRVVETVIALRNELAVQRQLGRTIGFVPTMGALHQGHLSLVHQASMQSDFVVVSIFVNPTQFNNQEDLERYPRNIGRDVQLLADTQCDLVFVPSVTEMYPEPDTRQFDFGQIDKVMEGERRPGHFNGVGQVVSKLFEMVSPEKAFFGLKDFQQVAVIKHLVKQLNLDVEIVPCPIVRETDGLAMSSRNALLTEAERKNASIIARSLFESCNFVPSKPISEIIAYVVGCVNKTPGFEVEYFEIVDGNTLREINEWNDSDYVIGCIAVFAGEVRLIDNVIYKN